MDTGEVLADLFGRVRESAHATTNGISHSRLVHRPDAGANSVCWLLWHLTRVQDDHVSEIADSEQVWTSQDWVARFGLPFESSDTGFGHTSAQVAQVDVAPDLLVGYQDAVHDMSVAYVTGVEASELDRIIDYRWDPPVSVGVRLVSVAADTLKHMGQAEYVLGMTQRTRV